MEIVIEVPMYVLIALDLILIVALGYKAIIDLGNLRIKSATVSGSIVLIGMLLLGMMIGKEVL